MTTAPTYRLLNHDGVPNGGVSWWMSQRGVPLPKHPLGGDTTADVCIVGGGLTGLWTAYYLSKADPTLRIVILEKEFAGYGASGRNGGWLSAEVPGKLAAYAATYGLAQTQALVKAMEATVDEVLKVCSEEGIDSFAHRGGVLRIARNAAQLQRLTGSWDERKALGVDEHHHWLDQSEARSKIDIAGLRAAIFYEYGVRVDPAALSRGLFDVVERRGVTVHEATEVEEVRPGHVVTGRGTVRAPVVLMCLEAYTASIPGRRRHYLPMNSSMIVTDVLPPDAWRAIGWEGREVMADSANSFIYSQRTHDDRIAWGGRGVPCRFGSRFDTDGVTHHQTVTALARSLHEFLPSTLDVPLAHAWCGVFAVPRDWTPSVTFDRVTGVGLSGGYTGSGLSTTNLGGRMLTDLVLGSDTALTALPWANRAIRAWELEPVRWMGARSMYFLFRMADRREDAGLSRTSRLSALGNKLTGR